MTAIFFPLSRLSHLCLLGATLTSAWACTSTETGNPVDAPEAPAPPALSTPVELQFGIVPSERATDVPVGSPGISGFGATATSVWLRLNEVEFLTCDDQQVVSESLSTQSNLSQLETITVQAASDATCGLIVRAAPLLTSEDLPEEAVGAGALITAQSADGGEAFVILPQGQYALLAPTEASFSASDLEEARLEFDQEGFTANADTSELEVAGTYTEENAPRLIAQLTERFSSAFRLTTARDDQVVSLAVGKAPASETSLLCQADCSLSERASCGSCDADACLSLLDEGECGPLYSLLLACRVGEGLGENMCNEGQERLASRCQNEDADWRACSGKP